jgi:hypothetical protein
VYQNGRQHPHRIAISVRRIIQIVTCFFIIFSIASAESNNGAEKMDLPGGDRGKVPFPHLLHQENLGDCDICHSIFPKVQGSIEDMKGKGEIKEQYVMKKLCTKCHKKERMAGKPHGPTTCAKCHIR